MPAKPAPTRQRRRPFTPSVENFLGPALVDRPTTMMVVGTDGKAGPELLREAVAACGGAIFGAPAIKAVSPGPAGCVVLQLAPGQWERPKVDDPAAAQTLEVEVSAALARAGCRGCAVAVRSLGASGQHWERLRDMVDKRLEELALEAATAARDQAGRHDVASILETRAIRTMYQPIADAVTGRLLGYEALSRGPAGHHLEAPLALIDMAQRAGMEHQLHLEMAYWASRRARERITDDVLLFINMPPTALWDPDDASAPRWTRSDLWPWTQVVLEVTERTPIEDVPAVWRLRDMARGGGARFALDDAGAGYAGLAALALLAPEFVKIDMGLVRQCDQRPNSRAVIAALVHFSKQTGAQLIAEGIETYSELETIRELGVDLVQGYLIAAPAEEPPAVPERWFATAPEGLDGAQVAR